MEIEELVRHILAMWKSDPEGAHRLEFETRSKVIDDIASGKLKGKHAVDVCAQLTKLTNNKKLTRWFA